jgi:hypothetical protein
MLPSTPAVADPPDHDAPPCSSQQLTVSAFGPDAAADHRAVTLNFAIAPGAAPCTLTGYPRVESVGGGPFDHARPTLRGYMGGLPPGIDGPPTITVSPSQQAQSILEGMAVNDSGEQCPGYTDLRVIPPGTTQGVLVAAAIDSCQLEVHPVTPVTIEPGAPATEPGAPPAP